MSHNNLFSFMESLHENILGFYPFGFNTTSASFNDILLRRQNLRMLQVRWRWSRRLLLDFWTKDSPWFLSRDESRMCLPDVQYFSLWKDSVRTKAEDGFPDRSLPENPQQQTASWISNRFVQEAELQSFWPETLTINTWSMSQEHRTPYCNART